MHDPDKRSVVERIGREIADLSKVLTTEGSAPAVGRLAASWAELVDLLALGPAPELRECPGCGHTGMSAATLCGYCWTRLTPPPRGAGPQA